MLESSSRGTSSSRPQKVEPALYSRKGESLSLSRRSLVELLEAVLGRGAQFRFCAKGYSMSPFIRDGDILTLSRPESLPCIGDVVAFFDPKKGRLIVHRVVGRVDGAYITKGDNCTVKDGFMPYANLLGRVTKVERQGKVVFIGLGLEKFLIAHLSHRDILIPLFNLCRLISLPIRRFSS